MSIDYDRKNSGAAFGVGGARGVGREGLCRVNGWLARGRWMPTL